MTCAQSRGTLVRPRRNHPGHHAGRGSGGVSPGAAPAGSDTLRGGGPPPAVDRVLVSVDGQRGQFAVPFRGPLVFAMVLAGWMYSDGWLRVRSRLRSPTRSSRGSPARRRRRAAAWTVGRWTRTAAGTPAP